MTKFGGKFMVHLRFDRPIFYTAVGTYDLDGTVRDTGILYFCSPEPYTCGYIRQLSSSVEVLPNVTH